jgi:Tol biopolymer transport system component
MLGNLLIFKQRVESGVLHTSPSDLSLSTPPHASTGPTNSQLTTMAESARSTSPFRDDSVTEAIAPVHRSSHIYVVLVGLLLVSLIAFGIYKFINQPKLFGPIRMAALTTGGKVGGEDINGQLSISPDGKYVVCTANDQKQQASLWIRQVSTNSLVRLVPPENGAYLSTTFSPDGEFIYYVATLERNKFVPTLYRIPVLGGTPAKLLDHVDGAVAFSKDGSQLAFVRKNQDETSLMVANTDGTGEPKAIASLKQPSAFSSFGPSWSPDNQHIANSVISDNKSTVVEVSVASGETKTIGAQRWASVGRVIWLADGSGLIIAAQPESSSVGTQIWFLSYPGAEARRITNDLNGYGDVSLGVTSDARTIATIQVINNSSIWVSNPNEDESRARQILKTNLPESVAWTPDGRIVYSIRTGENWDIWIAKSDGSESKQLTSDAFTDQQPTVSGDGRYVVYQSTRSGARNLWRIDLDGANPKQLTSGSFDDASPVSSPDGRFVVFQSTRAGKPAIWKVSMDGGNAVQLSDQIAQVPVVSPDGKLVSFFYWDAHANNQPKLGLIPFEGGERVKTIDLPTSVQPIAFSWMPDGKSIAYLDNSSGILNVWSAPIDGGAPKQLTDFKSEFITSFSISREGKIAVYRFSATRDIVLIKDFR